MLKYLSLMFCSAGIAILIGYAFGMVDSGEGYGLSLVLMGVVVSFVNVLSEYDKENFR